MKHFFSRSLMLILALAWLVPKMTAQDGITFTVNTTPVKTIDTSGLTGASATGKQMAVANDVTYVVYPGTTENAFYYVNMSDGKNEPIAAGAKAGWGIATDDSRNLVTAYGIGYTQKVKKVRVYKATSYGNPISASTYKDYDLTDLYTTDLTGVVSGTILGRTDFWHASGNCYDGDGALWFTDGTTVVKIPIEAGVAKKEVTYTLPSGPNTNGTGWITQSAFDQYATDEYIFQNGTGVWDCKISGSTITATKLTDVNQFAADIAYLQGHKIFVRSNTRGTRDGIIVIEDITTGTAEQLATITISPTSSTAVVNAWCEFEQIDDLTLGLYVYVPGGNTYKYTITATLPDVSDEFITVNTTPVAQLGEAYAIAADPYIPKQMAVANDIQYVVYPRNTGTNSTKLYHVNMSTVASVGTSAAVGVQRVADAGWGIATDDAKNLVTACSINYSGKIIQVQIYKASSGFGSAVTFDDNNSRIVNFTNEYATNLIGNSNGGRTDYWSASGNLWEGEGALWFTDGATVVKIPFINGEAQSEVTYTLPAGLNNTSRPTEALFDLYADNEYLYFGAAGIYDCQINNGEITGTQISSISGVYGSDIEYLQGHKVFVGPANSEVDGDIVIKDLTTGKQLASFNVGTYTTNKDRVNAWCEFEKVDELTLALHVYVPRKNHIKYLIKAKEILAPVQNLEVMVVRDLDPDEPTRQDAILSWTAPDAESEVESYDVYYRTRYTREGKDTETVNSWNYQGNTTELTMTDVDVRYYQTNGETVLRYYDYKVIPVYSSGSKGEESEIVTATPDFIPFVPDWDETKDQDDKKFGIDRYDGYCKVQLYWKFPQKNNTTNGGYISKWGCKPDYYSILRNGKQIATNISVFNYIDKTVMPGHDYVYNVVAHYYSMPDTAVSDDNEVHIDVRDWSKISYELSEVYNYPIATEGDSVVVPQGDFLYLTDRDSYRQGQFYNGYWYVAQLKNLPVNDEATAGGIYRIPTAASWENTDENPLKSESFKKIYTTKALQSAGIAIDEGGNIFIAQETTNDNTGLVSNYFANRLTKGRILMNTTGDGITYSDEQSYDVDLSGFNFAEYAVAGRNISLGRIDFFCMKGNLTGGTAQNPTKAYLYLAPNVSRAVYVIELTFDGTAVTASEHYKYDDYSISLFTGESFQDGGNNYAFPVMCEGRDNEFIHNLRSSAYSWHACHANLENNIHESGRQGTVYDTQSRVNNSGGCTIEWNGELFVITPQSQYSANSGNFYVGAASRSSNAVTAKNADLKLILPIDMWTQPDEDVNVNTNSSGVWLAAEKATDASGSIIDENKDGEADYIYIYMYVPGERFAKYKMTPSSLFPPSQVSLEIEKKYKKDYVELEHNPGGDIIRFDAKATWPEVTNYGTTAGGNPSYVILGYTVQLVDANGNVIDEYPSITFEMPRDIDGVGDDVNLGDGQGDGVVDNLETAVVLNDDGTVSNADGSLLVGLTWDKRDITHADGTISNDVTCFDYVFENVDKNVDYVAQVTVNYYGIDTKTTGKVQQSPKTEWEDVATFDYDAPSGYVRVDESLNKWGDWDNLYFGNPAKGEYDAGDIYYDEYRISLAIANPAFTDMSKEPVTYYTISYNSNSVARAIDTPVNEFYLYAPDGYVDTNGNALTANSDGYVKITNGQIPGDYDFNSTDTGGKPHVYWDMEDYTAGVVTDEVDYRTNGPSMWTYSVTANYAATNAKISEVASDVMIADEGEKIPTGVEVVETTTVLSVYPIPATVSVTIKCGETIDYVELYSESGMLVKTLSGNGEQLMTVDVSDLASGYYFLRVNNFAPVKFIKR